MLSSSVNNTAENLIAQWWDYLQSHNTCATYSDWVTSSQVSRRERANERTNKQQT